MIARISLPTRNAMQSGNANSKRWLLEFEADCEPRSTEPLMGWTSSKNTLSSQVRLWFTTREEAVDYAIREGIAYHVIEPKEVIRRTMSYSDNFRFDRVGTWTH